MTANITGVTKAAGETGVTKAAGETGVAAGEVLEASGDLTMKSEELKGLAEQYLDEIKAA